MGRPRHVPLFVRLFVPNATVLAVACAILFVEPANGRLPALIGGLAVMVVVNVALIRRAVTPLTRLTRVMRDVDLLSPGPRVPVPRQQSEVTVLAEAFNEMLERLERERRDSSHRAVTEREAERRRIAGELHDDIGQLLTAIGLQLDRVSAQSSDGIRDEICDARDGVMNSVEKVRRLAGDMRPETLDALGLAAALTNLVDRLSRRTGIRILRALHRDLPPLDDDVALVFYRVAQEALTNAVRHADASCIEIALRAERRRVVLSVVDDGRGIPADRTERGLRSMRERALSIGGELDITARPSGGTVLRLGVPVAAAAAGGRS